MYCDRRKCYKMCYTSILIKNIKNNNVNILIYSNISIYIYVIERECVFHKNA